MDIELTSRVVFGSHLNLRFLVPSAPSFSEAGPPGSDVTAVANAWRDYDQDAATAWKNRVDGDASAFQTYGGNTATAAQTAATNIAALNVTRVSNIASDLSTYTGTVNPAVKSFKQSVWGAMTPWMTSASGAEKAATDNSAGAVKAYETSLFAEVRNQGDDFANAADSFVNNVLGDWLPYARNVATANATAAHNSANALNTLLTSARNAGTTHAQDNRASTKTYKLAIVGSEDPLMSAYAADRKGQSVLNAVNNYNNIAATPLGNFNSQIGQTSSGGMGMMMGTGRPSSDDDYLAWADNIAAVTAPPAPAPVENLRSKVEAATKPTSLLQLQQQRSSAFAATQQALRNYENSWPWNRSATQANLLAAMSKLNTIDTQLAAAHGTGTSPTFATGSNHPGYNVGERLTGGVQIAFGAIVTVVGGTAAGIGGAATVGAPPTAPVSAPIAALGVAGVVLGFDQMGAGFNRLLTGQPTRTMTGQLLDVATCDPATSEALAMYAATAASGGAAALQAAPGWIAPAVTSTDAPTKFRDLANNALNRTINAEQHVLLRNLFKGDPAIGLTRESLEAAAELSRRALLNPATSENQLSEHIRRIQLIFEALINL